MNLSEDRPTRYSQFTEEQKAAQRASTQRWRAANPEHARKLCREAKRRQLAIPENRVRHLLGQARRRAVAAGMEFAITLEDVLPLPTHCQVLGLELNYAGNGKGFQPTSPSLDRFDSTKGYVPGNVRVISMRANRIKADATVDEVRALLAYMEGQCN